MTTQFFELTFITPPGALLGEAVAQVMIAGTKTPAVVYQDSGATTLQTQPILIQNNYLQFYVPYVLATEMLAGMTYTIISRGTSDFTLVGAPNNNPGTTFVATDLTPGTGQLNQEYDLYVGGGNVSETQIIQNIWTLNNIWNIDESIWLQDTSLWSTDGTVAPIPVAKTNNIGQLYTGYDIIRAAMRLIQVSAVDVDLTANELKDGLESLNRMLDSWSLDELMLYEVKRETFPLIASQNPYSIGLGGIWNTVRPTKIVGAYLTLTNGSIPVDYPMQVINFDDYNDIRLKTLQTNFPGYLYYQASFPIGECYIYPLYANNGASTAPGTITLTSWKPLPIIVNPTDYIELPPGYWEAIVFNLAIRIAEEYQFDIRPTTVALGTSALLRLKRMNQRTMTLQTDVALMNTSQMRYNIYSDGYGR